MLSCGATTMWEQWFLAMGNAMNSHNHASFGLISGWFYSALAGIVPDAQRPGFEHLTIRPNVVEDLGSAGATLETVRGRVASSWERTSVGVRLTVEIPA